LGRLQAWTFKYTGGPVSVLVGDRGSRTTNDDLREVARQDAQSKHEREINHEEGKIVLVIRETGI